MICFVVGARPNFVKAAPVVRDAMTRSLDTVLIHTEQHYDENLSKVFFRDLDMPEPDIWLGVGSGSHARQTAEVMTSLEPHLRDRRPSCVVVFGDVNSTLAAALVAAKLVLPVAHVESGLRSGDRSMPEEINRVLTDHVADLLFVTEPSGVDNLREEGIDASKVHHVGNTMIDSLMIAADKARPRRAAQLEAMRLEEHGYALLTLHRPSNVDDPSALDGLMSALGEIAQSAPILFPVHPRTRPNLGEPPDGIRICEPIGYLDFVVLMEGARLVLTDSGGIQEETTALDVPCVTIRDNTERPVTVTHGTNVLAGTDPAEVLAAAKKQLEQPKKLGTAVPLWDGRAAERIIDVLASRFE